ncbi:MAG: hypothetical protein K2G38_01570 [Clostridia bacterium]|nr:hypothetical protein [Clostridia bacterium]
MKKIFKALAVLAATTAIGAGIGMAAGCSKGYNGTYEGEYKYEVNYGTGPMYYGMSVKVTVENNIITKVVDTTPVKHPDWHVVSSAGWGWTDEDVANWSDNECWLLQKYEGWAVSDILAVKVYIENNGVPYDKGHNDQLLGSELIITNATQSSGRLMLAIQNALGGTTEIGRVEKAN